MAKKKRKSGLPKRIAGVKVPKSVRKGRFGRMLGSRTGQALLAEALLATGAVGVAKQAGAPSDDNATDTADRGPRLGGSVVADALRRWQGAGGHGKHAAADATIAYALGEAARVFVRTINEQRKAAERAAEPAQDVEAEWAARDADPQGSKKKPALQPEGSA